MIKKFIKIQNVGVLRDNPAKGDVDLRRLNLIHGENGRGKSTLCAILRSLQSGNNALVIERKTLDGADPPYIDILCETGSIKFKDGAWEARFEKLEIFDSQFVSENVYAGDVITHDHKKNLCRIVLGAEGVVLADKFDKYDGNLRIASGVISTAREAVQAVTPRGMTPEQFMALAAEPDVDQKIEAKQKELTVASNADTIRKMPGLTTIDLPQPPPNLTTVLKKSIDGVSADAAQKVREHIRAHGMRGEAWIAEGLRFASAETCPFCAQRLDGSDMIDAYRDYFSKAYRDFQNEINQLKTAFDASMTTAILVEIENRIAGNKTAGDFWKPYVMADAPTINFKEINAVIILLRDATADLVDKKLAAPLEVIEHSQQSNDAIALWKNLRDTLQKYNAAVGEYNKVVAGVKRDAAAKTAMQVQKELDALNARKSRHQPEVAEIINAHAIAVKAKAIVEQEKATAKGELDAYNEKVMGGYKDAVNQLLERFNAPFTLGTVIVEYTGRTPRTAYTLAMRGKEIDPGTDAAGNPSFRNTLSSGDRNTLALALFIAQVMKRKDLAELVIVFDDPFTSLDGFRQNWTCNTIRKLATTAKQVIVLSHSLMFLKMIASNCDLATLRTLRIDRFNTIDSRISIMDLDDATAPELDKSVVKLRNYITADDNDPSNAIKCIRPLLENYIRIHAPDQCPKEDGWLGGMLGKIRTADATSPLALFQKDYDELDYLNDYSNAYHHDPAKVPQIDPAELLNAAKRTMKLIGRPVIV